MLPVADGSDFGGSLRNPGNFNNVVGFRPSVGLVPFAPDPLPLLGYFVNGPIARTVADAAFLLSVMAGEDARDPLCYPSDPSVFREPPDDVRDVRGVRVAWCPDLGGLPVEASVRAVIDARRRTFEDLGCLVEDAVPDLGDADEIFLTVRRFRSAAVHGPLLGTCRDRMKADAIAEIEAGQALGAEDLARAMVGHGQLLERLRRFDARFDFIVCVVNQVAPFNAALEWPTIVDGVAMGSYTEWMKSAYWISTTFRPAISVPAGFTPDGLPVGIQIVGRPRGDLSVLRLAQAFEQATRAGDRRPPEALPVAQPQLRTTIVLHDSLT
jgi:amidase